MENVNGVKDYYKEKMVNDIIKLEHDTESKLITRDVSKLPRVIETQLTKLINLVDKYKDIIVKFSEDKLVITKLINKSYQNCVQFYVSLTNEFNIERFANSIAIKKLFEDIKHYIYDWYRKRNIIVEHISIIRIYNGGNNISIDSYISQHDTDSIYTTDHYSLFKTNIKKIFNENPNIISITLSNLDGICVLSSK